MRTGVIGTLMGPGLNSTLAFTGEGAIVCASEPPLDLEVVVGGVEKKGRLMRNLGEFILLLYK